jgi:hypothetical protein
MSKTHQLIAEKLKKYPADVQELAYSALDLSETMPESSVTEQLKGVIRQIIKEKEESQ